MVLKTRAIVLIPEEEEVKGMLNFCDFYKLHDQRLVQALREREAQVDCHSPTNIQFTSGTTGFPKAATLTHHNVLNNGRLTAERLHYTHRDVLVTPVPLYHCFGMVLGNLAILSNGGTLVYPSPSFEPKATLDAIFEEKATSLYGVPTMFLDLMDLAKKEGRKPTTLRKGIVAGSLVPEPIYERIILELGINGLTSCYGMTETSPTSFQNHMDDEFAQKTSSVGLVHPFVEAKVVNDKFEVVPRNTPGELWTKGYLRMQGYWCDEEKSRECMTEDGWMRTGDIGIINDKGYLKIDGRIKDMIIRGGENISPKEVEEFYLHHPDIFDC